MSINPSSETGTAVETTMRFSRLKTGSLSELTKHFEWSESVASFITPHATFGTVMQSLTNHTYWFDASTLLAHALPLRESIWWSIRVAEVYMESPDADTEAIKQATEVLVLSRAWVADPTEESRMKIYELSSLIPNRNPAHWVGLAVFWSSGNITPDAGIITPPPPYLYARAVSAAIDLACNQMLASPRDEVYANAIGLGVDIASGGSGDTAAAL